MMLCWYKCPGAIILDYQRWRPPYLQPLFTRFAQIGRVCLVNTGDDEGKIVAIVDIVDQNRALVDGPNFVRKVVNFKRLNLTNILVKIQRGMRTKTILSAWKEQGVQAKWEKSAWSKKLVARQAAATSSDFDRFKSFVVRKRVRWNIYIFDLVRDK